LFLRFITKTRDDFYNQHELTGGYIIITHPSTDKKKRQLEIPRFALYDNLRNWDWGWRWKWCSLQSEPMPKVSHLGRSYQGIL